MALKTLIRILIAIAFLAAAIICYIFGAPAGGVLFLILGLVFEATFWGLLLRKNKTPIRKADD